jgi:hypothetical protein
VKQRKKKLRLPDSPQPTENYKYYRCYREPPNRELQELQVLQELPLTNRELQDHKCYRELPSTIRELQDYKRATSPSLPSLSPPSFFSLVVEGSVGGRV